MNILARFAAWWSRTGFAALGASDPNSTPMDRARTWADWLDERKTFLNGD